MPERISYCQKCERDWLREARIRSVFFDSRIALVWQSGPVGENRVDFETEYAFFDKF